MLSSIDVTRFKRFRLWVYVVALVVIIAMTVAFVRPHTQKVNKRIDNSMIEIKYDDDSMQKWTSASELQIRELLSTQQDSKKTIERQNVLINNLEKKTRDYDKKFASLENKMLRIKLYKIISNKIKENKLIKREFVDYGSNVSKGMEVSFPPYAKVKKDTLLVHNFMNTLPTGKIKSDVLLGWFPMGSFFNAVLLNGVEAGTGSNAEANPQPVLMRVTDNAILPNAYRYYVSSCFVLGSAYGALSSERAFIRTAEISCVGHNGRAVITAPLKGFVVDTDGKIGLRGLLVNRQGEKLAKAMLSGFFAGLSGLVGQVQGTSTTGSLGMANMLTAGTSLQMAGLNGVSNATNELAQFYINEAKRLFPVIEINPGRLVTINLSQGVSLRWQPVSKQPLFEEEAPLLVKKPELSG